MVEYAKSYTSFAEKMMRFSVFKENLRIIADLMAGQTATKFGIGPYTDMTGNNDFFHFKYNSDPIFFASRVCNSIQIHIDGKNTKSQISIAKFENFRLYNLFCENEGKGKKASHFC